MYPKGRVQAATSTLEGDQTLDADDSPRSRPSLDHLGRGDSVGRYLVLGLLGRGGMGDIYVAHDPELDRKIALKIVRRRNALDMRKEAQALARFSHPNIVSVHDVGELPGGLFIAMEFVQGQTLRAWFKERARSWDEVARVLGAAGRGLAAAHGRGLMHLDFKPDNVMLRDDGRVIVLDFGLAQPCDSIVGEAGMRPRQGTPAYMSPEQHLGEEIDARADQFAFCVTWFECVLGARPFPGRTAAQLTASILEGSLAPPSRPRGVRRSAYAAIVRGCSRDPLARWPTMDELLEAVAPASKRGRATMALAATTAMGIGVAGTWAVASAERDCSKNATPVREAWSSTQRTQTQASLVRANPSEQWVNTTLSTIDDYADALAEGFEEACRVAPDATPRRACLNIRLEQLTASAEVISDSEPSPRDIEHVVAGLQDVHACRRADEDTFYADVAAGEGSASILHDLAQGAALAAAGRVQESEELLTAAAEAAHEAGWVGIEATARLELAREMAYAGSREAMFPELERALELAARAKSDEVSLMVMIVMLREHGLQGDLEAVQTLAPIVEAAGTRVGRSQRSTVLRARGNAFMHRAMYAEAEAAYEAALQLDLSENASIAVRSNLAAISLVRGHFRRARELYVGLVEHSTRARGPQDVGTLESKANLADAHQQLGEFEAARVTYEEVLAAHDERGGSDSRAATHVRMNFAYALIGLGRLDEAEVLAEVAHKEVQAAHGDAHIYSFAADDLKNSLAFYRGEHGRALKDSTALLERMHAMLGEDTVLSAAPLGLAARAGLLLGDTAPALAHLERARVQLAKINPEHPSLVTVYDVKAQCLLAQGDIESAAAAAKEANARAERVAGAPLVQGLAKLALAEVRAAQGQRRANVEALVEEASVLLSSYPDNPDVPAERLEALRVAMAELAQ